MYKGNETFCMRSYFVRDRQDFRYNLTDKFSEFPRATRVWICTKIDYSVYRKFFPVAENEHEKFSNISITKFRPILCLRSNIEQLSIHNNPTFPKFPCCPPLKFYIPACIFEIHISLNYRNSSSHYKFRVTQLSNATREDKISGKYLFRI